MTSLWQVVDCLGILHRLRLRAEGARFQAHSARTYAEDVANLIKGLSRHIYEICLRVRDVRADISVRPLSRCTFTVPHRFTLQNNSLRERERQAALRGAATTMTRNAEQPGEYWLMLVDVPRTMPDISPGEPVGGILIFSSSRCVMPKKGQYLKLCKVDWNQNFKILPTVPHADIISNFTVLCEYFSNAIYE